jgi:transcriptional regulator with XRE-family HTH domain
MNIKQILKTHNLTAKQLAQGIGSSVRTVQYWANNTQNPTPAAKVAIGIFLAGGEHGTYTRKDWLRYKNTRTFEQIEIETGLPMSTIKNLNTAEKFTKTLQFVLHNRGRV